MKIFITFLSMDPKKPDNPSLHGWKSMTTLCPDDVCKEIKEKEEEVMHGEDEREGPIRSLKTSEQKVMSRHKNQHGGGY